MRLWKHFSLLMTIVIGACAGSVWTPHPAAAALATVLFADTSSGEILRTDSGTQWQIRQNLASGDITALAASQNGRTLYAASSGMLWRSIDAGNHWIAMGTVGSSADVNVLVVDPRNPDVVYAGSDGLYQTTDSGASWVRLHNGLSVVNVLSIAIDSHDSASVWAGDEYNGLYHSTDGGSTWASVTDGVLPDNAAVHAIALSPADSSVIDVGTDSGFYQSLDDGTSWVALGTDVLASPSALIQALAISPSRASRVYVATTYGMYVSSDGGSTWSDGNGDLSGLTIYAVVADPHDANQAYVATDRGVYYTTDGGVNWNDWAGGNTDSEVVSALMLVPVQRLPSDPAAPQCCGVRYFSQTNHNLGGAFLAFWQHYGGVDVFGYPRTEPFTDNGHVAQYTDRFELEYVKGHVITPPLGRVLTTGRSFPRIAPFPATHGRLYFSTTGHSLSGRFLTFWQSHHGSILLGAPISEVTREQNGDNTGRVYRVQWFQNGRLEYHPELAGTRYEVEIGLTGKQNLQRIGWLR